MTRLSETSSDTLTAVMPGQASPTIAVASGKGGVGKTWLSITLAAVLAARGERVLLFDCDSGLANIDIQLGLTPLHDLSDFASGRVDLDGAVSPCPGFIGGEAVFSILPGRSGASILAGLATPALDAILSALRNRADQDLLILDLGAGIDRITRRLAAWADTLLVVTTEEPTALADAYAVLKLHARDRAVLTGEDGPSLDSRIIVNQAGSLAGGERAYATLAKACSTFLGRKPPLAGIIRRDPNVGEAIRRQALLVKRHPNTQAAAEVEQIATGLRPRLRPAFRQ